MIVIRSKTRQQVAKDLAQIIQTAAIDALVVRQQKYFFIGLSGGIIVEAVRDALMILDEMEMTQWLFFLCHEVHGLKEPTVDSVWEQYRCQVLTHFENLLAEQFIKPNVKLPLEACANNYEIIIRRLFRIPKGRVPEFDLLLLNVGIDGHTCALYPGSDLVQIEETKRILMRERELALNVGKTKDPQPEDESEEHKSQDIDEPRRPESPPPPTTKEPLIAPITQSPKPPPNKVTMTFPVLNAARSVVFIATGASRTSIVRAAFYELDRNYPVNYIDQDKVTLILDADAEKRLPACFGIPANPASISGLCDVKEELPCVFFSLKTLPEKKTKKKNCRLINVPYVKKPPQ